MGRQHKLDCCEYHAHTAPKCCAVNCWCLNGDITTTTIRNKAAEHQKNPEKNKLPIVQDMVVADIIARKAVGKERYGTYLQPFNGRNTLMDAYQEALDLAIYLRSMLYEQENPQPIQFCEHCGPVPTAYKKRGTTWCPACMDAEGWTPDACNCDGTGCCGDCK
jgi:hypothetical protein